ncbi:MAG: hypothetical protein AB8H80_16405 [Planctomycetota bacterium]
MSEPVSRPAAAKTTWPALAGLAALFLALFAVQRSRSDFLAIEAQRDAAVQIAEECGLTLASVFALRDAVGMNATQAQWREAAVTFAGLRAALADEPGALGSLAGPRKPSFERFQLLRARFATRAAAHH